MRPVGHLLLWIGFLSAAFWSVCRLEQDGNKWSTVPWHWYAASMVVGVVGVVLLRAANRQDHADDTRTDAEYSMIQQSLSKLAGTVSKLAAIKDYDPSEVIRCIDDECAGPFAEFADARQALVKRFGLQVYADVMTEFAAAERYVNRTWSAAADGYVEEVAASLDRANQHLQNAQRLVVAAENAV